MRPRQSYWNPPPCRPERSTHKMVDLFRTMSPVTGSRVPQCDAGCPPGSPVWAGGGALEGMPWVLSAGIVRRAESAGQPQGTGHSLAADCHSVEAGDPDRGRGRLERQVAANIDRVHSDVRVTASAVDHREPFAILRDADVRRRPRQRERFVEHAALAIAEEDGD